MGGERAGHDALQPLQQAHLRTGPSMSREVRLRVREGCRALILSVRVQVRGGEQGKSLQGTLIGP